MGLYFDQSATVFWRRRGGTSKPTRRNQRYSFVASPSSFFDPVRKIDPFLFCSRNSTITRFERKGRHGNRSLLEDKRKVLSFFLLRFFVSFLFSHRGHRKKRQRERDPLRSGPNKPIIKHNAVANIGFVVLSPRGVVVLFFLCFFLACHRPIVDATRTEKNSKIKTLAISRRQRVHQFHSTRVTNVYFRAAWLPLFFFLLFLARHRFGVLFRCCCCCCSQATLREPTEKKTDKHRSKRGRRREKREKNKVHTHTHTRARARRHRHTIKRRRRRRRRRRSR